jgi:hypothetical protein
VSHSLRSPDSLNRSPAPLSRYGVRRYMTFGQHLAPCGMILDGRVAATSMLPVPLFRPHSHPSHVSVLQEQGLTARPLHWPLGTWGAAWGLVLSILILPILAWLRQCYVVLYRITFGFWTAQGHRTTIIMHKYSVQRTLENFWWWLAQSGP